MFLLHKLKTSCILEVEWYDKAKLLFAFFCYNILLISYEKLTCYCRNLLKKKGLFYYYKKSESYYKNEFHDFPFKMFFFAITIR